MRFLLLAIAGLAGGVLAGMGMGGGTLTIPLLVLLLGVEQLTAQYANLIAFLPSGSVALALHAKNGLVDVKGALPLLLSAAPACVALAYLAPALDGALLKKLFGGFLTAVAVISLFTKTLKKS